MFLTVNFLSATFEAGLNLLDYCVLGSSSSSEDQSGSRGLRGYDFDHSKGILDFGSVTIGILAGEGMNSRKLLIPERGCE